jgi:transposase
MTDFIQGENRYQVTLFPEKLDDYIDKDNAVRAVDAFVDHLDLADLGFRTVPSDTGRPAYHPAMMLKLYIYGYLNRIHSSRRLEREAKRNVELMWLTGRLAPDFKTIADFRKDNGDAIKGVCRRFIELCRHMGLLEETVIAIDGSKFKAVNTRDRNFTKGKLKRRRDQINDSIARYIAELESADRKEGQSIQLKTERLQEKLSMLAEELDRLDEMEHLIEASPDQQVSLTDPDARSMATSGRGSGMVGYNVQTAVDANNHLIVAHEVTQDGHDRRQLYNLSSQAKEALQVDELEVVADRGYFRGEEILACDKANITTYLPKPLTSGNRKKGLYTKRDFIYHPKDDEFECPAGERLTRRTSNMDKGLKIFKYWSSNCRECRQKDQCTTGKERRIGRWEHEHCVEAMEERLDREPERMRVRRSTAEHPFATLKSWMGYTHFSMKGLEKVGTEISLHVLAYNLKRTMNLIGVQRLIAAM